MLKSILCGAMLMPIANNSLNALEVESTPAPTFVYVHGFGEGGKKSIPFEKQLNNSLEDLGQKSDVKAFIYSKAKINFTNVLKQWQSEKALADKSGLKLYEEVLLPLEEKGVPYSLIAYSLGTRVVADCLEQSKAKLKHLKGIYFVGSALPHDVTINRAMLPVDMKIVNYHSSNLDYILKISFRVAEGKNAGGEVGFDDSTVFKNMRTVCTHARKGGPITRDYSDMAEAIIYLSYFNENKIIDGDPLPYNLKSRVLSGSIHWNDLIELKHTELGKILIQQNVNTGHYRAVNIDADGTRTRIAWGGNMHTILKHLGFM